MAILRRRCQWLALSKAFANSKLAGQFNFRSLGAERPVGQSRTDLKPGKRGTCSRNWSRETPGSQRLIEVQLEFLRIRLQKYPSRRCFAANSVGGRVRRPAHNGVARRFFDQQLEWFEDDDQTGKKESTH